MNEKEVREIRRRFRPNKSMIGNVYGCYVSVDRKIVPTFEEFRQIEKCGFKSENTICLRPRYLMDRYFEHVR